MMEAIFKKEKKGGGCSLLLSRRTSSIKAKLPHSHESQLPIWAPVQHQALHLPNMARLGALLAAVAAAAVGIADAAVPVVQVGVVVCVG